MSLFGALFTGVSALSAQSQSMAMISNNIANVNTTGFKRTEAAFYSLVTSQSRLSRYSPGTVAVNRQQRVDQQGPIQQTSSSTDAAISGNGFFPVKRDNTDEDEFLYTRNGSFSEDSQGLLRNTAGFVLYAWALDADGNLPAAQGDLTSLVPADVAFLGGLTRPTSTADLSINLDASQEPYNSHLFTTPTTLPIPSTQQAHFSRTLRVFDSLGTAQDLNIEYRKVVGPMAHATTGAFGYALDDNLINTTSAPGLANGNAFTITAGGVGPVTFTVVSGTPAAATEVQTVSDLINRVNAQFPNQLEARLNSEGRLVFQTVDPTATIAFAETSGTPLTGLNTLSIIQDPDADGTPLTFEPEAPIQGPYTGTAYPSQSDFPTFSNVTNPNTQGWWEATIYHPDGSVVSQGLLNFNGDGSLNAAPDSNGDIGISLTGIDWGNGADPQDLQINIDRFSQFAGNYNVIFSDQNGAELGLRTGVQIDREGFVIARFSNGASATLYKIPMVTFANSNGLQEVSGTAYKETQESGANNLREAGAGGAGMIEPSTTENSNVDLADEFAKMIVTQRAYSAGTKIINTADQMTEELLRLR